MIRTLIKVIRLAVTRGVIALPLKKESHLEIEVNAKRQTWFG
jgi:hypothetical protein